MAGRPLLVEFAATLAAWEWDVALLQEVPPWWPATLADACGADHRSALTSRNSMLQARRAIAARNPDLLGANGGGANAILVRGEAIAEHLELELTRAPERRVAHAARLSAGWVVNLHASREPKDRTRADVERAANWLDAEIMGGDLNLREPTVPGLRRIASHHVDHIFARGDGSGELLEAGRLSDHRPLVATVG